MFCPNCGTKNEGSAEKCSQCGFDVKAKAGAAKFKGTMMLKGSPVVPSAAVASSAAAASTAAGGPAAAAAPSAAKPKPNLKGTMVGVAPPGMDELQKQLAESRQKAADAKGVAAAPGASAGRPNPNLKGTMVGVAPPGINAMREAQKAAASTATESPAASRGPVSSQLKGTMIGVAPPDMSKEVEAAKAKLAAQKAAASAASTAASAASTAASAASTAASAASTAQPQPSRSPSQLKGTMIGVAPPDMQAELAKAKAAALAQKAAGAVTAAESPSALAGAPAPAGEDKDPPSAPDPLGGTMVGTSPFAAGFLDAAAGDALKVADGAALGGQAASKAADDFSEDTPAAGTQQTEETRRASAPDLIQSVTSGLAEVGSLSTNPETPLALLAEKQAPRLPIAKSNTVPIVVALVLLVLVVGGFLLLRGGDKEPAEDEKDLPAESTDKAKADQPKTPKE